MTHDRELRLVRDDDDDLKRLLRAAVTPPADASYWDALEARIMARVRADGTAEAGWWTVFEQWGRAGLAAAAVALVVAGLALQRAVTDDARRVAYETVIGPPTSLPAAQIATGARNSSSREATLRYVISH